VSQDIEDSQPGVFGDVEGPPGQYCRHCREAPGRRAGPQVRGSPAEAAPPGPAQAAYFKAPPGPVQADKIEDAIDQLAVEGPALRRPLADRVKGSRYHNMKELRPPSSGATEIRLLFAFGPRREAIFLVAGDKAGNWDGWYRQAIPLADERFTQHLIELEAEEPEKR
jgi:hypothetical protein